MRCSTRAHTHQPPLDVTQSLIRMFCFIIKIHKLASAIVSLSPTRYIIQEHVSDNVNRGSVAEYQGQL